MQVEEVACRTALSKSNLPGLDYALNPYRGCEHGCTYCYAPEVLREDREWGNFLDIKRNMPLILSKELKGKRKGIVGIGTVTDAYQPAEAMCEVTRRCLEVLLRRGFPVCIQTKSDLVLRDMDLIKQFEKKEVAVTITTMNERFARMFEPFAPSPRSRLSLVSKFADEGVDTWVFMGPILPVATADCLVEFVEQVADAGATKIVSDRLRLRGNIRKRIESSIALKDEEYLARFREMECSRYYHEAEKRIALLCAENGIRWETAFPSERGGIIFEP